MADDLDDYLESDGLPPMKIVGTKRQLGHTTLETREIPSDDPDTILVGVYVNGELSTVRRLSRAKLERQSSRFRFWFLFILCSLALMAAMITGVWP